MTFRVQFSCLMLMSLVLTAASISAQTLKPEFDQDGRWINGVSEPWMFAEWVSAADAAAVQTKWLAIAAELAGKQESPWAGNYFEGGDTHGTYFRWSPQAGFVSFDVDKCAAQVMAFSHGTVVVGSNGIKLSPQKTLNPPKHHSHGSRMPPSLVNVTWRGKYLVPDNQIGDFCDYVAGLGKYNHWAGDYLDLTEFFEKLDGESGGTVNELARPSVRPSMDLPDLPLPFQSLLKKPIDVEITRVGAPFRRHDDNPWWDDLVVPVTINRGQAEGVTSRMEFKIAGLGDVVSATRVGLHSSQGNIVRTTRKRPCVKFSKDDDCSEPEASPIVIGLKASTSSYRYDVN